MRLHNQQRRTSRTQTVVVRVCFWLGLLCAASTASAAKTKTQIWNGFSYLVSSNEVMITACKSNSATLEIPAEINGQPVRSIGRKACANKNALKEVIIPDSVYEIGAQAFELCVGLTSVKMGKAVARLGDGAFASCYALQAVQLPEGLASMGSRAFQDCRSLSRVVLPVSLRTLGHGVFVGCAETLAVELAEGQEAFTMRDDVLFNCDLTTLFLYPAAKLKSAYRIPDSVTHIAGSAFEGCRNLETITIPQTVTSIGSGAFHKCAKLQHITMPDGVMRIEWMTFKNCSSLTNVVLGNRVTNISAEAFFGCSSLPRVAIPDSVITLGDSAFSTCGKLEEVTLGSGLERLGTWAFGSCRALTNLRLPDSLKSIGDNAFEGCSITSLLIGANLNDLSIGALKGVEDYVVAEHNTTYRQHQGVLFSRDMTTLVRYPPMRTDTAYRVPDGVTTLGPRAFMEARWLKTCALPATLTKIGEYAFYHSALEELAVPDSVTNIESCAFLSCAALRSVRSLGRITYLDNTMFPHNEKLERIVLPATLQKIEHNFVHCPNLAELVVADGNNAFRSSDGVLFNRAMTELIRYLPQRQGAEYRVPDGVTTIRAYAFADAFWLKNLSFAVTVTNIGAGAFHRAALRQISIPPNVRKIGAQAFGYAPQLEKIIFEGDLPSLNAESLANVSATVCFLEGGKGWDKDAVYGRPVMGLSSDGRFEYTVQQGEAVSIRRYNGTTRDVRVPARLDGLPVTAIGAYAFASNATLASVTLPVGITGLATRAFASCANLQSVFFDGHAPDAAQDVFRDTLADTYHRLNAQGWNLHFAERPAWEYFHDNAFAFMPETDGSMKLVRCFDTNLIVTVPAAIDGRPVVTIGPQAFADCQELMGVTIPASVRRIGARAFANCYRLTSLAGAMQVAEVGAAAFETCYSLTNAMVAGQPQGVAAMASGVAAERINLRLHMANGDTLTGSTALRTVAMRMDAAVMIVPLAHILAIKPGTGDTADAIRLCNGDTLKGKLERKQIDITGSLDVVEIALRHISTLEVVPKEVIEIKY